MNDMLYKLKIIKVISSKSSMYQATTKIKKNLQSVNFEEKGSLLIFPIKPLPTKEKN